jgi:hypothetical protein
LLDPAMTTAVLERLRHPAEEDDDPRYKSLTEQERNAIGLEGHRTGAVPPDRRGRRSTEDH